MTLILSGSITITNIYSQGNPLIVTCPPDVVLSCTDDVYDPAATGLGIAEGGCSPQNILLYYEDFELVSGCSYTLERIYYAYDDCANEATCSQIIEVIDDQPMVLNCPDDFFLASCTSPLMPQQTGGLPSYVDNCSEPFFEWADVVIGTPDQCCEPYTIERTWTAYDQCMTPTTCVQLIFVPAQNCDDGDPCTEDYCEGGVCFNVPINCDDGDPCTIDECVDGTCVSTPVNCDDGDPCTVDVCLDGNCFNTPMDCDDGDPCTTDFCDNGVCRNEPILCDDGDPCTEDACVNGQCVFTPMNCDDGDPCTVDECINGICQHTPVNCDDGDPCTIDYCDNGACVNEPLNCDDGDPNTMDYCMNGVCYNELLDCNDDDPCTEDLLENGVCINTPINCDDGDPNTFDYCDNGSCVNEPIICFDGDPCTNDYPVNGVCVFEEINCDDGDPCTEDFCIDGVCHHEPINCDDGDPCTIDACNNGVCTHPPISCDDGDPCTEDFCDSGDCYHEPIAGCGGGDPPVAVCNYATIVFVDLLDPNYNGPFLNNIYLESAEVFDDGSISGAPIECEVKRLQNYVNFEWTTNGACEDVAPNSQFNDKDRGKIYRNCLPIKPNDFFRWRSYSMMVTNEYGQDECTGYYFAFPYLNWNKKGTLNPFPADVGDAMNFVDLMQQDASEGDETEIEPMDQDDSFMLFPNPGRNEVILSFYSGIDGAALIRVLDVTGKTMSEQHHSIRRGRSNLLVDTGYLEPGTYIIHLQAPDHYYARQWFKAE